MININKKRLLSIVKVKKNWLIFGIVLLIILLGVEIISIKNTDSFDKTNQISQNFDDEYMKELVDVDSSRDSGGFLIKEGLISSAPINNLETAIYEESVQRKIIKNGNLSLIVKSIEDAKKEIQKITVEFNGFIQTANFSENENYKYYGGERRLKNISKNGFFELKIPSKNFKTAFEKYKKVALKINNESINSNDVTEQFLDLETQIKNKKAEVEQYRSILKTAKKIEDVLKVTQYLNSAQVNLERKQGRLNYLSNQVELSSIRIDIIAEKDVEVFGVTWSPLTELKNGFSSMIGDLRDFASMIILMIFKLPVLILKFGVLALALLILFKIYKKIKNKI